MQTFAVFFYMSMFLSLPMMTLTVSYFLLFHTTNFRSFLQLVTKYVNRDLYHGHRVIYSTAFPVLILRKHKTILFT